ncbi:MAG TPA: hypothetical protein DCY27_10415, partial [Desulfobacterales bacterium]|nr:hypothetical protein [Desulfobacterales bacterium]
QVHRASSELEYLIGSFYERISLQQHQESLTNQGEQQGLLLREITKIVSSQERSGNIILILTILMGILATSTFFHQFSQVYKFSEDTCRAGIILAPILCILIIIIITKIYFSFKSKN